MEYKIDLQGILKDDQTCSANMSHMNVIDSQPLLVKSQEDRTELLDVNVEVPPCDSSRDAVCFKEEVEEDAELLELVEYNTEISKIIEAPSGNNNNIEKLPISFKRKICYNSTVDWAKLKQRMHTHKKHRCKRKLFKCNLCDYSSAREFYLNLHMCKHNGEKPYKCKLCDFSSTRSHLLKQHMYMHTPEKPFICNVCDNSCAHLASLKLHMQTHAGIKPYKCKVCDHSTAHLEASILHTRTHSDERSFKCTLCDYSCAREFGFKLHMRTHTPEMQSL